VRAGPSKVRAFVLIFALAAITVALSLSAATATATNCPYISASQLAHAFGLKHATAYHVEGPAVPEYAAYQFSLCREVAWSGGTPANEKQAQAKIDSGHAVGVVIKTAEQMSGTPEEIEAWHRDFEQQTEAWHAGGLALAKAFHGSIFIPPAFGAPSEFGYEAVQRRRRGVNGIWYSDSQFDYIQIGTTQGKGKPGQKNLEKVAAIAVPGFGA
jgi:hypothetical protein